MPDPVMSEDPPSIEDHVLVAQAARGEVEALAHLYDRYQSILMTVATRMLHDRQAAEDLVHDVFIEVWRHAHRYEATRGSVRAWLLVRLRSRALDRLRSATARHEIPTVGTELTPVQDLNEDPSLAPDRNAVRWALLDLPEDQRRVLELSYFQGLSSTEIATLIGSPTGTVKSRAAAGLSKLRSLMNDGGSHER